MKNQRNFIILIGLIIIITFSAGFFSFSDVSNQSKTTDMLGRGLDLPSEINKVYSITFSTTVLLYMLAPEKMVGWDSQRTESDNKYLPKAYQNLPVLGGGKSDANYESIISMKPDLVLVGHGKSVEDVDRIQQKFGNIPVFDIEGDNNITNITPSIRTLGSILGKEGDSNELIAFHREVLNQVYEITSKIPESEKKKVYYARDATGLKTNPSGASHTQLIDLCGGKNIVDVPLTKGSSVVSIEMIMEANPDVIIASDPQFYKNIYSNPLWKDVKAVQNKEVYLVPNSPFNWFEGPPGANTIIGIPWTAKVIYPDKFKQLDLETLTIEFYSKFYHYNLTDGEVRDIIVSSGLKMD